MNNKIKAVVFDIDGTLMPEFPELRSWLRLTSDLGLSADELEKIFQDMRNGKISYPQAKTELIKLWQSFGKATKKEFSEIFSNWALKEDAEPIFKYLNGKGYKTGLITGSVDLFAEIVARKVGADEWYANTELMWDEAGKLDDFVYTLKQGEKKLEQFKAFCAKNMLLPTECAAVGDGENDVEIFKASGHGIAVHSPSSLHLDPFAWKKVKDLGEIEQLLP
ncbi:MAG: hypothetical protein A3B23_03365 [Candidatus Colwellbacteria bacterium RIFCSPLOWO2_01_FULL_48_10]|uniref:phosphoserine phosphatase n=2 Tax=Bacteria candidate phyla TaxID=1783234 RepID=A0A1F5NYI3_9BACT|nr:MAG: hypothetical protein A2846_01590 [Candidatus Doudnabacteria bacterium RIFCSPHIGHO2_01_FULL_49_9]OGY59682.1 MAG: hypothetical protein A3B23_03365 [Candidatus Colwellbacteria bacterium RIFCSPLOWO2_01_FULL_48_10]